MKELIKISEVEIGKEKVNAVNARELHEKLEVTTPFHHWIERRLEETQAIKNQDFTSMDKIVHREIGASSRKEYILSLDIAKHIAMLERSEKGREVRQYFIDVEKKSREAEAKYRMLEKELIDSCLLPRPGELQKGIIVADIKLSYDEICGKLGYYSTNPSKTLHNILGLAMYEGKRDLKESKGDIDKMKDLGWYVVDEISFENVSEFS